MNAAVWLVGGYRLMLEKTLQESENRAKSQLERERLVHAAAYRVYEESEPQAREACACYCRMPWMSLPQTSASDHICNRIRKNKRSPAVHFDEAKKRRAQASMIGCPAALDSRAQTISKDPNPACGA